MADEARCSTQASPSSGFTRRCGDSCRCCGRGGEAELKLRVVVAVALVLAGKAAVLLMPFAYKGVIDRMSSQTAAFGVVAGLVAGYATARFAGVLSDNLRNALFEKVGQNAARRLAGQVFRHIHDLSLRFHLERRTGWLTKIVERGTKSIDMMLYFILFNIAPTVIELAAICIIFFVSSARGLVAATLAIVADLHRLHPKGHRLAGANPARHERRRQPGDRPRRRLACSTTRPSNISAPRTARRGATTRPSALSPAPRCATRSASPGSISARPSSPI